MQTEAYSFPSTGQGKDKIWQIFFLSPLIPILVHTFKYFSYKVDTECYCEGMYLPQKFSTLV